VESKDEREKEPEEESIGGIQTTIFDELNEEDITQHERVQEDMEEEDNEEFQETLRTRLSGKSRNELNKLSGLLVRFQTFSLLYQQVLGEGYSPFIDKCYEVQEEHFFARISKSLRSNPDYPQRIYTHLNYERLCKAKEALDDIVDDKYEPSSANNIFHEFIEGLNELIGRMNLYGWPSSSLVKNILEGLRMVRDSLQYDQEQMEPTDCIQDEDKDDLAPCVQTPSVSSDVVERAQRARRHLVMVNETITNHLDELSQKKSTRKKAVDDEGKDKLSGGDRMILHNEDLRALMKDILVLRDNKKHHPKVIKLLEVLDDEIRKRNNTNLVSVERQVLILELVQFLREREGYRVDYLFGGNGAMDQHKRALVMRRISEEKLDLVLGTTVMDEGLHTRARTHIDYSLSDNPEKKTQREGRVGRSIGKELDGKHVTLGRSITLVTDHPDSRDVHRLKNLLRAQKSQRPSLDPRELERIAREDEIYRRLLKKHKEVTSYSSREKTCFWVSEMEALIDQELRLQLDTNASREDKNKVGVPLFERFRVQGGRVSGPFSNGGYCLNLDLQDKTGVILGKIWGYDSHAVAQESLEKLLKNPFIALAGKIQKYHYKPPENPGEKARKPKLQISLDMSRSSIEERICFLKEADYCKEDYGEDYLRKHEGDGEKILRQRCAELFDSFDREHLHLHLFLISFFEKHRELGRLFSLIGAGQSMHHDYQHGLLEHSVNVASVATALCDFYPFLNKNLLLLGGVLHDIGKTETYRLAENGRTEYSEGEIKGKNHILAQVRMIEKFAKTAEEKPLGEEMDVLINIFESHQGEAENEMDGLSPFYYIETMMMFFADCTESWLNGMIKRSPDKNHIVREVTDLKEPKEVISDLREERVEVFSKDPAIQTYFKKLSEHFTDDISEKQMEKILTLLHAFIKAYPCLDKEVLYAALFSHLLNPHQQQKRSWNINTTEFIEDLMEQIDNFPIKFHDALYNFTRNRQPLQNFSKGKQMQNASPETFLLSHVLKWVEVLDFFASKGLTEHGELAEETKEEAKKLYMRK